MMPYPDLFIWWAATISAGILFQVLVSIYLYPRRRKGLESAVSSVGKFWKNFAFVWILVSLLILYIVSINAGSYALFAAGNIVVEVFLLVYVIKNSNR
jgi:hypothetical protein